MRVWPDYFLERELWGRGVTAVAGVDEVGVGALAGPVVAAAVILVPNVAIDRLADSKLLTPKRREALFTLIRERAVAIATGQAEVQEVDRLNVYWAAMEARRRASRRYQPFRLMSWSTANAVLRVVILHKRLLSTGTLAAHPLRQHRSLPRRRVIR